MFAISIGRIAFFWIGVFFFGRVFLWDDIYDDDTFFPFLNNEDFSFFAVQSGASICPHGYEGCSQHLIRIKSFDSTAPVMFSIRAQQR